MRRRNPIVMESSLERQRRLRLGYIEIVEIDAAMFKALFEQHRGEKLAWSSSRAEAATTRPTFTGYPIVYVDPNRMTVDVEDGRHRINEAARRGVPIQVTGHRGVGKLLKKLGLVTTGVRPDIDESVAEDGVFFIRAGHSAVHGIYSTPKRIVKEEPACDDLPFAMEDLIKVSRAKRVAYVSYFEVSRRERGVGTGSLLMAEFIRRARDVGARSIFLVATPYEEGMMPNLLRFYDRFGFKEVARSDSGDWVGMELKL